MKLEIKDLHVEVDNEEILKGVNLEVEKGKVHALMGPNGSGKSTLANVLMGNPKYKVTHGRILLDGEDIIELEADERAKKGLFMSFQYPNEITGVTMTNFLRTAYNSIHKEKLGWFNVSEVIQISADGSYTLSPLETIGGGVKAFYTKKEPYPPVYYEFRQPIGFDDDITQNVSNGLLVHLEKYGNSGDTQILDNTPETVSWLDPALSVGSTFTDLLSGVKAKVLNKDPNSLTFDLKFSPTTCIQENPSVSISPISQWSNPGESLAYTVSLINNDNSICSSSTFNLSAAISAGWTSSFLSTTLDVAPGQTGTATVTVTSPQTNPDGFYNFSVTATDNTSSLYEDSSTATYVVDDSIAPLVSIASPVNGTTVSRKSTVVINVSASDNVSVTKVEFYVDNKLICTDSAYTYSCNWKVPPSSNRTYNLQAKAFDVAGNISTSSTVLVKSK